jgi:hypothetical protein
MPDQWQPQYQPRQQRPATPPQWQPGRGPQPPQGWQQHASQPPCPPQVRTGQPQPPAAPPVKAPRRRRPVLGCMVVAAVAVGAVIVIVAATSGGSGGSFKAAVENYTVINPADLAVAVHVTNTGSTAATPTCTVTAQDPSGAYSGFDEGTLTSPVQPGATTTYVDNVTISGQGAQYVTQVSVTC